jgi:hypothetical protein
MAESGFSRFIPPNLRQPLNELGALAYQLGDNVFGLEDEYDTMGELLRQSLREDPIGTAGSIASGVVDSAKAAYDDPMGTLSALGDEFATAYEMLSTPMAMDASREEVGQRLEAASLLSSVIPGYGAVGAGTKVLGGAAANVVDAAQLRQAERFRAENEPQFPGQPFATTDQRETQFFYPDNLELMNMIPPSTPPQADYLTRLDDAKVAISQGADPADVAYSYGVLPIPRNTLTGDQFDPRFIAALTPQGMASLRPDRASNYSSQGLKTIGDPDLAANNAYFAAPPGEDPVIAQSPKTPAENLPAIQRHEMTHADLYFGDVPYNEVGSSTAGMPEARLDALDELNRLIRASNDPEERQRLIAHRDDIRSATSFELYQRNPGEMLARLAEGVPTTARALTLTQALNPYIRPNVGLPMRLAETVEQSVRGERAGILSVPLNKMLGFGGYALPRGFYSDAHAAVPMDLSRAVYDATDGDEIPF